MGISLPPGDGHLPNVFKSCLHKVLHSSVNFGKEKGNENAHLQHSRRWAFEKITREGPFPYILNHGGAERDRTADLLNAIQALSHLSYSPTGDVLFNISYNSSQAYVTDWPIGGLRLTPGNVIPLNTVATGAGTSTQIMHIKRLRK